MQKWVNARAQRHRHKHNLFTNKFLMTASWGHIVTVICTGDILKVALIELALNMRCVYMTCNC